MIDGSTTEIVQGEDDASDIAPTAYPPLAKILALQEELAALPQVEMPITHHFADGVYAREVFHPAGVAVVGYMHRTDHLFILAKGDLTIQTDEGRKRVQGPCIMHTRPGMKRLAYAHENCVVITIHATNETDPEKIMGDILVPEPGSPLPSPAGPYHGDLS